MDETKLDSSFPNSQVRTDRYIFIPYRRDRDNHGGDKMIFISRGLITKRFEYLETKQFA